MAEISKRLEAMRRNPVGDWRIDDVEAVCREHGILCAAPRGGGSHYKVGHPSMNEKLTIPYNGRSNLYRSESWSPSSTR